MSSPEPSYPTTTNPAYSISVEASENDLKTNLVIITEVLKEEMKIPLQKSKQKKGRKSTNPLKM